MHEDSRRHTYSCNHGREETDGEEDDERETNLGGKFILSKVFAQGDEGGEVGRRREGADVENKDEMGALNFEGVLGDLYVAVRLGLERNREQTPPL